MEIAVSYPPDRDRTVLATPRSTGKVARVEIFEDMMSAEPYWRRLEAGRSLATPYQRFDLLSAWQYHVGARTGVTPFIVVGLDEDAEPLFLWPFGRTQKGLLKVARFLGSKHANFNVGLWRRDSLAAIGARELRDIFDGLAARGHDVDLVALLSQPLSWDGIPNPLSLLPHQASVDMSARLSLDRTIDDAINDGLSPSMRSRLRAKERKLQHLPGYRYLQAATDDDVDRLLDSFFAMKSTHMAAQGLGNVFADPGVVEFLREACRHKLPNGRRLIEIHAIEGGGEVLAVFGTTADDYCFSSMFNTYTLGENARHSPGLVLITRMIAECASRGLRSFDIGVGRAHYKSFFCREPEPLFDTFLPLTRRGRLAAAAFGAAFAIKRVIKHNDALWSAVQAFRRVRARG
jgi:CelD/BcsL family acetyltransferase involved in cellulose biosynthesis